MKIGLYREFQGKELTIENAAIARLTRGMLPGEPGNDEFINIHEIDKRNAYKKVF